MNRLYIIILTLLFGNLFVSHAQLSGQGTWNKTTIDASTSPDTTNPVIELTGDINQKGCITIEDGYTLTIRNVSGRELLVHKNFNDSYVFYVKAGGGLIIEGTSDSERIVLDCGANFIWNDDYSFSVGSGTSRGTTDGIFTAGTLSLNYVTIRNYKNNSSYRGAIQVQPSTGPTDIDHCIIENCQSGAGAAIMIHKGDVQDSESCRISVSNSVIRRCLTDRKSVV